MGTGRRSGNPGIATRDPRAFRTAALAVWLLAGCLAVAHFAISGAGEPPQQLKNTEELSSGLYKSGDHVEALKLAKKALVLVETEMGAGSERAAIRTYSVGLSAEAAGLATGSFAALARSPRPGRAEALRQALLAMIAGGHSPAQRAPFVIVGEGGAR
jgi:hypothetical protein